MRIHDNRLLRGGDGLKASFDHSPSRWLGSAFSSTTDGMYPDRLRFLPPSSSFRIFASSSVSSLFAHGGALSRSICIYCLCGPWAWTPPRSWASCVTPPARAARSTCCLCTWPRWATRPRRCEAAAVAIELVRRDLTLRSSLGERRRRLGWCGGGGVNLGRTALAAMPFTYQSKQATSSIQACFRPTARSA